MKASKLFLRTTLIITVLTIIPHAFSAYTPVTANASDATITEIAQESLLGKWKTRYEEFDGEVIYEFRLTENKLEVYSIQFVDPSGYSLTDDSRVMHNIIFSDKKGTAIYELEYENDTYSVDCELTLQNKDTLEITYTYMGYEGSETWTRLQ